AARRPARESRRAPPASAGVTRWGAGAGCIATAPSRPAPTASAPSRVGHAQHVERGIELLLGEGAVLDVPLLDLDLPARLALGQRLLGDLGGSLVAEVSVQRRDDRRRRLGQLAAPLDVRGDA